MLEHHLSVVAGPLPSPDALARYKATDPRCLTEILDGFRSQHEHRQEMERQDAVAERTFADRGQKMGVAIAGAALLISGVVGIYGSPIAAAVIVSVGVGAPVVASFSGRPRPSKPESS